MSRWDVGFPVLLALAAALLVALAIELYFERRGR